MNKLQRIEEMEKQLAALRAEVEQESKAKRWEPKGGEWYYSPRGFLLGVSEKLTRLFGVERKTREQAEADYKLARAYNRLLAYKAEFDADFVPDWDDGEWDKFYLYSEDGIWFYGNTLKCPMLCAVYFSEQAAKDLCSKLNSGEVVF